jgi:multidrug efflux system outer membrane protein
MKKLFVSSFTVLLINSLLITTSFAADKVFVVNPTSLREQLFSKNMSLLQALNNVENSKLNVSMARAKLLPSLNLAVLLPALANPTFLLGSVTFLFPFLIPSNWAVLSQQKELFESDKMSYKALELNILSNALSLYYTFLNDVKVQQAYYDQSLALEKLYTSIKIQSEILGNISVEKLNMALAQWDESKIRASKLQELVLEEKASLRTLLGLPLGYEMKVDEVALVASGYETQSASEIADHSLQVAPEVNQLAFLIKAAKAGKFSKLFGFMNSASVAGTASGDNSAFGTLKASGGFTFGADNLVNIKIADNNTKAILLRAEQLKEENEKVAEIFSGKMNEIKEQQNLSESAMSSRMKVFEGQKIQYELGLLPLQTLLLTESQLTDSKVNSLKIELDLNMQRLALLRLVVDGDFSKVKGCTANLPEEKRGPFHLKKEQSLDQLCQQ